MKGVINNKSTGNDGLTKEIYETFWNEIIDLFYKSRKTWENKKQKKNRAFHKS